MDVDTLTRWLSPSKVAMLGRCQYQFFRHYILGESRPPSAAMAFGSAFDDAVSNGCMEGVASGEVTKADSLKDIFQWTWEMGQLEVEDWRDEKPGPMLDQGVALIGEWRDKIGEGIHPQSVQAKLKRDFPDVNWGLEGIIDLVFRRDKGPEIVADTKTTARAWRSADARKERKTPAKAFSSLQVPCYSILTGLPIFEFHVCTRGKKPDTDIIRCPVVGRRQKLGYLALVARARQSIIDLAASGAWMPTAWTSGHFLCSRRWCGWHKECVKEFGGQRPE